MVELTDDMILWDGFDDCILGVGLRCCSEDCVVYDGSKMIQVLMNRDGMTYEEAYEYMDYNIIGAYVGKTTPVIVYPIGEEE